MKDTILEKVKHARYHYVKVDNMEEFKYNFRIGNVFKFEDQHRFLKNHHNNSVGIFKKHSYTEWKNIKEGDIVTSNNGTIYTVTSWDMGRMGTWEAKFYRPTDSGVKLKLRVKNAEGKSKILEMHEVTKVKRLKEIFTNNSN